MEPELEKVDMVEIEEINKERNKVKGRYENSECEQSGEKFEYDRQLRNHMKMNHVAEFECTECKEGSTPMGELGVYEKRVHMEAPRIRNNVCAKCEGEFKNASDLEKHTKKGHGLRGMLFL